MVELPAKMAVDKTYDVGEGFICTTQLHDSLNSIPHSILRARHNRDFLKIHFIHSLGLACLMPLSSS